jgi:uncharacterized protein
MKMEWCVTSFLLLVLCAGVQLHAEDLKVLKDTKAKAEKGNAEAEYNLGQWFADSEQFVSEGRSYILSRDLAQAHKWLGLASAQGYNKAKTRLFEVEQIEAKQKQLFEDADAKAVKGDADAQDALGDMYYQGEGVPNDFQEAMKWYRKAAEQGDPKAQYHLGTMFDSGEISLMDSAKADVLAKYLSKRVILTTSTNPGSKWFNETPGSSLSAGGNGIPLNYGEAAKWYRRAAEQGDGEGQRNLGVMYGNGNGVPQDYVEAFKWSNLAAAQGNAGGKRNRDYIVNFMTPEQIAEAQQRAAAFVARKETLSSDNSALSDNPKSTGTGFFITDDGNLISNYHVVKDATKVRLLTSTGLIDAKVVQVDAANDLALLKADGRFVPLPIAASRTVNLGGTVATVGFPDIGLQGFSPKLAKGEIASLSGAADDPRYFQISVPCQPGNSGGALVDERGNVIGIVSAKLNAAAALAASGALPENVNYAVKSSFLLGFLESVPDVSAKLKTPVTADRKFEDVVKSARDAAVLVLVY